MKKDISSRADVSFFVRQFYQKLLQDDGINYFFDDILQHGHLDEHLETITDFWEDLLFSSNKYAKNAMKPHLEMNKKIRFQSKHFDIWLGHFSQTIDAHFQGANANSAKERASSIASIMEIKLKN